MKSVFRVSRSRVLLGLACLLLAPSASAMFTFDAAGNFTGRVEFTVAEVHAKVAPAVITKGPFAGLPRAIDDLPEPAYDPATERLLAPTPDGKWNKVALSAEEIAAAQAEAAAKAKAEAAKAAAIEAVKAPPAAESKDVKSLNERVAKLEALVVFLLNERADIKQAAISAP